MRPTIAILGASTDRAKFGNKAVRAFRHAGYTVIPINPHHADVEGERAFATVLDYPGDIDEATIYLPPAIGLRVIEQVAQKGIPTVWLNPGADGRAVIDRARALGLQPITACSIIGAGESPSDY